MKDFLIIPLGILGATGAALAFVGYLFAIVVTMGKNRVLGVVSLFVPLMPIVYCLRHRAEGSYALRLFGGGSALLAVALAVAYGASWPGLV